MWNCAKLFSWNVNFQFSRQSRAPCTVHLSKRKTQRNSELDECQLIKENWVLNALLKTLFNLVMRPSVFSRVWHEMLSMKCHSNMTQQRATKAPGHKGKRNYPSLLCRAEYTTKFICSLFTLVAMDAENDGTKDHRQRLLKRWPFRKFYELFNLLKTMFGSQTKSLERPRNSWLPSWLPASVRVVGKKASNLIKKSFVYSLPKVAWSELSSTKIIIPVRG